MEHERKQSNNERAGILLLWAGVLMAPIAWLIQFEARYALVQSVCARQSRLALHLLSGLFFVIMMAGGIFCWRFWSREGKTAPQEEGSIPHERNVFLSLLGMLSSSLFAVVLIAQTIAQVMVDPCQH
jgi:hypothetical protein